MAGKRDEKMTYEQKEYLVSFMETNLEFARGRLLSVEGRINSNAMWEMLVQQLNSLGPTKDLKKWQRVWTQLKTKIKRKASDLSVSCQKTGSGPPTETPLTDIEEKVIFIISKELVYGLEGPDGVSLESEVSNAPSTSKGPQVSWVAEAEFMEMPESDSEVLFTSTISPTGSTGSEETTPLQTPPKKISNYVAELMQQNDVTNKNISLLAKEICDIKETLKQILDVKKREVDVLERIANALENKK